MVELFGASQVGWEAGEVVGGLGGDEAIIEVTAFTVDPDDLFGVGEQVGRRGGRGCGAVIDAAMSTAGGRVLRGKKTLLGGT